MHFFEGKKAAFIRNVLLLHTISLTGDMNATQSMMYRCAMQYGTCMGVFWIGKFILFPLGFRVPFLSLAFMVLTLAVPFLAYYYVRAYRNRFCGGGIRFSQAWVFTALVYIYAALLAAVAHFVYFQFIDQGFILNACVEVLEQQRGISAEMDTQIDLLLEAFGEASTSPIDITVQLFSSNVMYGSILAVPIALLVMRKAGKEPVSQEKEQTKID